MHECKIPGRYPVRNNAVWRCECGKAYVIRFDPKHGQYWPQWDRSPEDDE